MVWWWYRNSQSVGSKGNQFPKVWAELTHRRQAWDTDLLVWGLTCAGPRTSAEAQQAEKSSENSGDAK